MPTPEIYQPSSLTSSVAMRIINDSARLNHMAKNPEQYSRFVRFTVANALEPFANGPYEEAIKLYKAQHPEICNPEVLKKTKDAIIDRIKNFPDNEKRLLENITDCSTKVDTYNNHLRRAANNPYSTNIGELTKRRNELQAKLSEASLEHTHSLIQYGVDNADLKSIEAYHALPVSFLSMGDFKAELRQTQAILLKEIASPDA